MKTKNLFLILGCMFFIMCQKDIEVPSSAINEIDFDEIMQPTIHHSILNSTWWNNLPNAQREFLAIELTDPDLNFTVLESRMEEINKSRTSISLRAKVCPGYPTANPEGNVTLNNQSDVDAFGAFKCKEIMGELNIQDTSMLDPICDLSPLNKLSAVGSSVTIIGGECLDNLNGLENLKSIGELGPFGFVGVRGTALTDINGISSLKTITGSINILSCPSLLTTGDAFSKITAIKSGQTSNPITSIYVLNIRNNELLNDLSGFRSISEIENRMTLENNNSLPDLDDLVALSFVGNSILISSNGSLTQVNQLENISSLEEILGVARNPLLNECCGLYNMLCNDPPQCAISGVGLPIIFENGAGCTVEDIVADGPCS